MEALLRWNDPDRGLVFPDDFIPAAEEMSLLEPIGDWVIGALAQQIARVARARGSSRTSPSTSRRASCTGPTSPAS